MIFKDRFEAGRALAERLTAYTDEHPLILAIPRGGVPVAYQVARALRAPLDVVVTRKLGAPHQREFAFGAIAPDGVRVLDEASIAQLGLHRDSVDAITERENVELDRRLTKYRQGRSPPHLKDQSVMIIDDGIATGLTCLAAVRSVRRSAPRQIVVATPVSAVDAAQMILAEVDDFVSLDSPTPFLAVGAWYTDFAQVSDEEVLELLARSRQPRPQRDGIMRSRHDA